MQKKRIYIYMYMPNSNILIFIIILLQIENQNELTWGCLHIICKMKLFTSIYFYLTFKMSPSCFFTAFNWDLINILHTIKTSTNDAVYTSGNHFQLCLKFSNLTLTSKENRSKFCGNVNKPANANVSFMNF